MSDLKTMCEHGAFVVDCSICTPASRPAAVPDAVEAAITHVSRCVKYYGLARDQKSWELLVSALREARRDSERLDWLLCAHALTVTLRPPHDYVVSSLRPLHYSIATTPKLGRMDIDELRGASPVPETREERAE